MNNALWESLPENLRELMTEVAREAMERDQEALPSVAGSAVDAYGAAGGQLVELTDMDVLAEASPDMIAIWAERMEAAGHADAVAELVPLMRVAETSFDD